MVPNKTHSEKGMAYRKRKHLRNSETHTTTGVAYMMNNSKWNGNPDQSGANGRGPGARGNEKRIIRRRNCEFSIGTRLLLGGGGVLALAGWIGFVSAATLPLANGSFESPTTSFVDTRMDSWQKTSKPFWYDESGGFVWDQLVGQFKNAAPGAPDHIDNLRGQQAFYLFAVPEAGLFQDPSSVDWSNARPASPFHNKFEIGKSYQLTVGVVGGGGGMSNGVTLAISLYYRDPASNRVTVASTSITNTSSLFPKTTHLADFQVRVPTVRASDPWANHSIGVQILSTVNPNQAGGYWDVDDVRLAETIEIPNASFESPPTALVDPRIGSWQKTPKPFWYDESTGFLWDQLLGVFQNTAPGSADHIDNCDGNQALYLFAVPQAGLFQDAQSIDGTNTVPSRAFASKFEVGKSYHLTAGVVGGGGNMAEGVGLELSLYYRDGASNRVTVAATNIIHRRAVFSKTTHLIDFQVHSAPVHSGDPWAGQNIGVQLLSVVEPTLAGGYWDLDHVRLSSVQEPMLLEPVRTNSQFQFTLRSEPDRRFEILASTNIAAPLATWINLGTWTNDTGAVSFVEPITNSVRRFYRARPLP